MVRLIQMYGSGRERTEGERGTAGKRVKQKETVSDRERSCMYWLIGYDEHMHRRRSE